MNRLLSFIILLASLLSSYAANPSFRDLVWTNSSGSIKINGTNQPVFSPGILSGPGAVAYQFGTSNLLSDDTAHLAEWKNKGTNRNVVGWDGRISIGPNTENNLGFGEGVLLQSYQEVSKGDKAQQQIYVAILDSNSDEHSIEFLNHTNNSHIIIRCVNTERMILSPNMANGSSAIPYFFDTARVMATAGSKLAVWANNGTNRFWIDKDGTAVTTNGFASYSLLTTNSIGGTGYTNNQIINQVAYANGTAVTVTIKNRAGATIVPATAFTGTMTIYLQPGWAFTAASGLTGTVVPF
jgi:hypothetical protein